MGDIKNKDYLRNLICAVLAFMSMISLVHMIKSQDLKILSNSVLAVISFVGIYLLIHKASNLINRRLEIVSLLTGFVFSSCMILGANLLNTGYTKINNIWTIIHIIFGIPLFAALVVCLFYSLESLNTRIKIENIDMWLYTRFNAKKIFYVVWILVFISWIPGLIASYPGIYAYDSVFQMDYYVKESIYLHHPLIHTYILGFFVKTLGYDVFGSYEVGVLIYCIIQMLLLSMAFAFVSKYLYEKKLAVILQVIILLTFMFLPTNTLMSFSLTKDVYFAIFFLLYILHILKGIEQHGNINNFRYCLILIILSLLICAFRNQGIYVFIITGIIAILLLKKNRKCVLILFVIVLVLFKIYSGPITTLCKGVKANSTREMMSIPCVQLSRAMADNEGDISTDEKQLIELYIPNYYKYANEPGISDPLKNTFNSDRFMAEPKEFVALWLKVGIKCPVAYIDAFARLTIGWWYPDMNYRDPEAFHPYWEYDCSTQNANGTWVIAERSTPEGMKWISDKFSELTYENSYQNIPVISMLFSVGFVNWTVVLYVMWIIYKKKYENLVIGFALLGLMLTLFLGPVVLFRYGYPIMVCVPLIICDVLTQEEHREEKNNG